MAPNDATEEYDSDGDFVGHTPRSCGEHRTTGARAWCFDDGEWCSPLSPCRGCHHSQELICSGCESYLATLSRFAANVAIIVAFTCPDCGTINRWGTAGTDH